jgi:hypothetical protein
MNNVESKGDCTTLLRWGSKSVIRHKLSKNVAICIHYNPEVADKVSNTSRTALRNIQEIVGFPANMLRTIS